MPEAGCPGGIGSGTSFRPQGRYQGAVWCMIAAQSWTIPPYGENNAPVCVKRNVDDEKGPPLFLSFHAVATLRYHTSIIPIIPRLTDLLGGEQPPHNLRITRCQRVACRGGKQDHLGIFRANIFALFIYSPILFLSFSLLILPVILSLAPSRSHAGWTILKVHQRHRRYRASLLFSSTDRQTRRTYAHSIRRCERTRGLDT